MFSEVARKNEIEVVKAVMRLKSLKGLERIEHIGDRLYSHTNTRNRVRFIQICSSYNDAKQKADDTDGEVFKSWSHWICFYEQS